MAAKRSNEINLATYKHIAYQQLGPIPVIEVITMEVNAGLESDIGAQATMNTGLSQSADVSIGARYQSSGWSPVWEKEVALSEHDTDYSGTADLDIRV